MSVLVKDCEKERVLRRGFPHQERVEGSAIGERSFGEVAPQSLLVLRMGALPQSVTMPHQAQWSQIDVLPVPAEPPWPRSWEGADRLADRRIAQGLVFCRHQIEVLSECSSVIGPFARSLPTRAPPRESRSRSCCSQARTTPKALTCRGQRPSNTKSNPPRRLGAEPV